MATKPTDLPEWATDPGAELVEPLLAEKQTGWVHSTKPPSSWFNWWQNLVWAWVVWLDAFESEAHTWTGIQTFAANVITQNDFTAEGDAFFQGAVELDLGLSTDGPLVKTSADDTVALLETPLPAANRILIGKFEGSAFLRMYMTAAGAIEFTWNAAWNQGASRWDRDDSGQGSRRLSVGASEFHVARNTAGGANFVEVDWAYEFSTDAGSGFTHTGTGSLGGVLLDDGGGKIGRAEQIKYDSSGNGDALPLEANVDDTVTCDFTRNFLGETIVSGICTANTTIVSGTKIAQLPVGYRPKRERYFPIRYSSTPAGETWLRVQTNGRIDLMADGYSPGAGFGIELDAIRFDADF